MNSGDTEAKADGTGQTGHCEGPSHWEEPVVSHQTPVVCSAGSPPLMLPAPRSFTSLGVEVMPQGHALEGGSQSTFPTGLYETDRDASLSLLLPPSFLTSVLLFLPGPSLFPFCFPPTPTPAWNSAGNQMKAEAKPKVCSAAF